jgi:hypothetical protein
LSFCFLAGDISNISDLGCRTSIYAVTGFGLDRANQAVISMTIRMI